MNKPVFRSPALENADLRQAAELRIDDELAQSFPASDPPGWTLGAAEPLGSSDSIPGDHA